MKELNNYNFPSTTTSITPLELAREKLIKTTSKTTKSTPFDGSSKLEENSLPTGILRSAVLIAGEEGIGKPAYRISANK